MSDWRVRGVDQLALVNAYYDGVVRIREATLKLPNEPFFRAVSATAQINATSENRARKKRKRQQQQQRHLEELLANGKFVPLDPVVIETLQRAHEQVMSLNEWRVNLMDERCDPDATVHHSGDGEADASDQAEIIVVSAESHANTSNAIVQIAYNHVACVMPPHSGFLKGDVRVVLRAEAQPLGPFNFIIMDPPWENKSVDRKRCYVTFNHHELLKLPMQRHADDDGCVLAIWVTNHPTYSAFILNELLAHWGFTYHATWYWLKVCTSGELVSPLASSHRLPVEKLVVATRASSAATRERLSRQLGHTPKVVLSVPLRHSWKPPPETFFSTETLAGCNLEVFARELRPHFLSVGNEPLKFQTMMHFNKR